MRGFFSPLATAALVLSLSAPASAQWTALERGSDNIEVLGHLPLGPRLSVADLDIEQELDRPYAYVGRIKLGEDGAYGTDIIDFSDPTRPKVLLRWRIEDEDLHLPLGGLDVKNFQWKGRHYVVQSFQFFGGPDADLGAVVLDVTGLPDPASVREAGRIRAADFPGGFHNIFVYKHSDGRVLLFTTLQGYQANIYDLGRVVEGHADDALVGSIPIPGGPEQEPDPAGYVGYHDMYAAWHPDTGEDRFYGGGTGGYYVFDVTDLSDPKLRVSITGVSGVQWGHTFTPSPDGRYAVGETEYQYAPLRIFDMKPALDGERQNINHAISAWTADWRHLAHNHEVRWPFVFVSGYLDGLQVFHLMDPSDPKTVAYYDTYTGPPSDDLGISGRMYNGAFGVDVRNADGLIVISDMSTGFWTFRMEGFSGWNGADWGVPNISSVQDWAAGPAGSR